MKTLIVKYTPRGADSYTKKLLDTFTAEYAGKSQIETLDLTQDIPDMLMPKSLNAYIQRNFMGQRLSPDMQSSMEKMDRMTTQLKSCDVIALATPMYNFSLPSAVKAWFDSVMQKGETFDITPKGYVGLMKGKKAIILMASGGVYEGDMAGWEHAMALAKKEFQFMGFDEVAGIMLQGVNARKDRIGEALANAKREIGEVARKWYI